MQKTKTVKQIVSFEERLLSLRLKNSKEKNFLLNVDDKERTTDKKFSTKVK